MFYSHEPTKYSDDSPLTKHLENLRPSNYHKFRMPEFPPKNSPEDSEYLYKFALSQIFTEMPPDLTEFQQEEWCRCKFDFIHFLKRYAYIEIKDTSGTSTGRMEKYKPWPAQEELAEDFMITKLHIILKARQLGISWLAGFFGLWRFNFHCHEHILIESKKEDDSKDLLSKIMLAYGKLPTWMKAQMLVDSTKVKVSAIETKDDRGNIFRTGLNSKMEAIATGGGASKTVTVNIRDEAALVDNNIAQATHKSTMPTLTTTNGWCFIISTAEGAYGFFHDLYWQAKKGLSNFKSTFLSYATRPDRDAKWYECEMRNYPNEDDFRNQYPKNDAEAFLVSGRTAFSKTSIQLLVKDEFDPERFYKPEHRRLTASVAQSESSDNFIPELVFDRDGIVELWKEPEKGKTYVIGVDIAEGKLVNVSAQNSEKGDFSSVTVVCIEDVEYVARIKTRHLDPNELAREVAKIGRAYNTGLIIPEMNGGYGFAFLKTLLALYDNIYYRETVTDKIKQSITKEFGFLSTQKTRGLWINALSILIKDSPLPNKEKMYPAVPSLILHGSDTVMELSKFIINKKGKMEAASGEHDDEVVSLGLCAYIIMNDKWSSHNFEVLQEKEEDWVSEEERIMKYLAKKRWDRVQKSIKPKPFKIKKGLNKVAKAMSGRIYQ